MCAQFYIAEEDAALELQQIIDAVNRKNPPAEMKTAGTVRPTDTVPVIANSKKAAPSVFAMKWGYSVPDGRLVINARSETAAAKPLFRDGMAQRRCVIPATNYFEWEKRGKDRIRYAIAPASLPVMYMAGLYRFENGLPVFTVLTRAPADPIAFIHDRMPVILPGEAVRDWLDPAFIADEVLQSAVLRVAYRTA